MNNLSADKGINADGFISLKSVENSEALECRSISVLYLGSGSQWKGRCETKDQSRKAIGGKIWRVWKVQRLPAGRQEANVEKVRRSIITLMSRQWLHAAKPPRTTFLSAPSLWGQRVNKRDVIQPFYSPVPTGKRPGAPSLSDHYRVTCRANLRELTCVKWSKWGTFFFSPLASMWVSRCFVSNVAAWGF